MGDIWAELMTLEFDTIGSIHGTDGDEFRVGPMAFLPSSRHNTVAPADTTKCGPFLSSEEWLVALSRGDLDYKVGTQSPPDRLAARNDVAEYIASQKHTVSSARDLPASKFYLEHIDFSPHNILVDPNNRSRIVAVLDWEGSRIVPMWAMNPGFRWPSSLGPWSTSDPEIEPENRRLKALMRERIVSRIPAWQSAIGDQCRALRVLHFKALYSNSTPLSYEEAHLRMSNDIEQRDSYLLDKAKVCTYSLISPFLRLTSCLLVCTALSRYLNDTAAGYIVERL